MKLAKKRIEDYFPGTLESEEIYHLAYETGVIAYFIPGTTTDFILSKYREDSGIEYKDMNLRLLSDTGKITLEHMEKSLLSENQVKDETDDGSKNEEIPQRKKAKFVDFPYYEEPAFLNLDNYLFTPMQPVLPFSNGTFDQQPGPSSRQSPLPSADSHPDSTPVQQVGPSSHQTPSQSADSHPDSTPVQQGGPSSHQTPSQSADSHSESTPVQQAGPSSQTPLQSVSSHPNSNPLPQEEPPSNDPPVNPAKILNNLSKNVKYGADFFCLYR